MRQAGSALALAACILSFPAFAQVSGEQYNALREDAFHAAQGTIVSAAADALSNVTLRFGSDSSELAGLVRQREAAISQLNALARELSENRRTITEQRRGEIGAQQSQLRTQLTAVDQQIAQKFPGFSELVRPRPTTSAQLRAILNPDEAVLVIAPTPGGTYLFAVTPGRFDWARSSLTEKDIASAVAELRRSLDVNDDAAGAKAVFPRQTAFRLYRELVAPLEAVLAKQKVLFTATSGALQSLPLAVLVTQEPQGGDADLAMLAQTRWLVDKYALVTLPAISSLFALRCLAPGQPHAGCPREQRGELRPPAAAQAGLAFAGIGAPVLTGPSGRAIRGGDNYSSYFHGSTANLARLRELPALQGAERELKAIQALFPNGSTLLRLGPDATEARIKSDPDIGRARVLEFATHALIADEKEQMGEPGLVFTPPQSASATDDGLLTASEAARLTLTAEFVILSACNTARRDGTLGADGLAGLARAFFYAGARSLLVSHWSVSDDATPLLMQGLFDAIGKNPSAGRAAAFRQSVQALKARARFSEPRFWAPFVLVGDTDEKP